MGRPDPPEGRGEISLVFNQTKKDDANASVVEEIGERGGFTLTPRTRAKIMHNKFLVRREEGKPVAVLTGSANFTTEGLATQANVLHIFRSPKLARIYLERKELLEEDPTIGATAKEAGWSERVRVGDAKVSVFFPPEPKGTRESLDRVVRAVKRAKRSVLFCLFSPTDKELRDACFEAGDRGRMMFGVVNTISEREPEGEARDPAAEAKLQPITALSQRMQVPSQQESRQLRSDTRLRRGVTCGEESSGVKVSAAPKGVGLVERRATLRAGA